MSDNVFFSFLKNHKGLWKLGVLFLVGVLLLVLGVGNKKDTESTNTSSLDEYRQQMEGELADFLQNIDGVGKARVLLTLSRGEGKEYKGQELIGITGAEVYSVTVICEGGTRDEVKRRLTEMLSSQFGIGANRVSILPIK